MEKNKGTLLTIIILLLIFIPCTIAGMMKHFEEDNKKHEFYYNGKLHFYKNDTLIGTYDCQNESCDYAEYEEIDTGNIHKTSLMNNRYAFIKDGDKIYLQDIESNLTIIEYEELKGYSIPIENNSFITKNDDKWGIISLSPSLYPIVPNNYEEAYLNYNNQLKEISVDRIIIKQDDYYKIIENNKEIFTSINKIVEFNNELVVTILDDGSYEIVNYNNQDFLADDYINKYLILDNYLAVWNLDNMDFYSINSESDLTLNYLSSYSVDAKIKEDNKYINIYENDEVINSYEKIIEN